MTTAKPCDARMEISPGKDDELHRTVGGFGYIAAYDPPFRFAQGSLL